MLKLHGTELHSNITELTFVFIYTITFALFLQFEFNLFQTVSSVEKDETV